jgi:hypothetical protein
VADLTILTADVLTRQLRRLPPSLWDTDPLAETVQRELFQASALQAAIWLENRAVLRTMTLLLEAQGLDLDTLLADYGLKRYCQRPDPIARQVGMQILWTAQGTDFAVGTLADLLLDDVHRLLHTGRGQTHVFVALTEPVTTPYSYWGMLAGDTGLWYAVTVYNAAPILSLAPPPGLNVAPGPGAPLWFTVRDAANQPWYVSIHGAALTLTATPPPGPGTAVPFRVLDGEGRYYTLAVAGGVLVAVEETTAGVFGYWQLRDVDSGSTRVLWIEAEVPTVEPTAPGGAVNETPGGAPLDWIRITDDTGALWYVQARYNTLTTSRTLPAGTGTTAPLRVRDSAGTLWQLAVSPAEEALRLDRLLGTEEGLLVLAPAHTYEALRLVDSTGAAWWLAIEEGAAVFKVSRPTGAADVTPAGGPYRWLRLFALSGAVWYLAPSTVGGVTLQTTAPSGLGLGDPRSLGDVEGVVWHLGVTAGGTLGISAAPAVDYGGMATAICLRDTTGKGWFWRVRRGRLDWAPALWPDTMDQSPWGELGWLRMITTTSATVYVYPTLQGNPTATSAAPVQSRWGWQAPVRLVDAAGTVWHLVVSPTTVGQPEYWRLRSTEGTLSYLWFEAEVPTTASTAPAGGLDVTPEVDPLDTFAVLDELGRQVWVILEADTLVLSMTRGTGVATDVPVDLQDANGDIWQLDARQGTEALRTTLQPERWRVRVTAEPAPTIPPPQDPLALRDVVEAMAHVQAAGSLVTVRVQ